MTLEEQLHTVQEAKFNAVSLYTDLMNEMKGCRFWQIVKRAECRGAIAIMMMILEDINQTEASIKIRIYSAGNSDPSGPENT